MGDTKAAMLQEALSKVTAQNVLAQINLQRDQIGATGSQAVRIFAQQIEQVQKSVPGLSTTLNGNRFLVSVADRMGQFNSQIAQMARDWKADPKHRGILGPGWDQRLADWVKSHPIFTDVERSHPEVLGAPTVPPAIRSPMQVQNWGRAMGLKSGDPFRTESGKVLAMP